MANKIQPDDLPEPGAPLEPLDPELERLLAWFVKNRRRIAWSHGVEELWVTDEGIKVVK